MAGAMKHVFRLDHFFQRHSLDDVTNRLIGGVAEYLFSGTTPKQDAPIGVGTHDRHWRCVDDGSEHFLCLAYLIAGAKGFFLTSFKRLRHLIEGASEIRWRSRLNDVRKNPFTPAMRY